MSQTQPKIAIRTTSEAMTSKYEVMFDKAVESPAEHQEELYIMRQAREGDLVNMRINTDGGRMSTVSAVQGIVSKSDAHFHTILEGDASSAGSMIFLLGHTQEVYPLGSMYIHTCQSGMMGHAQEMGSYGKYIEEYSSNILDFVYEDFLTEEELKNVKTGGVIWLKAPEIEKRLEHRQKIREERLIEESKETYTPEFYAQSVLADITEDCAQFKYDVSEILELIKAGIEAEVQVEEVGSEETMHFKFGIFELTIYSDGAIHTHDEEPDFTSFVTIQDELGLDDLKGYADLLNVEYPHNIGKDTLAKKLDKKIQEIVDEMNQ